MLIVDKQIIDNCNNYIYVIVNLLIDKLLQLLKVHDKSLQKYDEPSAI